MAMPDEYKTNDVSSAYKKYYLGEKREFLHYTRRHVPHWQNRERPFSAFEKPTLA
jgi:hypothetical protein